MTLVSVIMPLFNKEATVARAVSSVLAQSHADLELIIVDDGSTDRSIAQLQTIRDPRLKIEIQANSGPGAARNNGAVHAEGTLLSFLDADDEWKPDFLQAAVQVLERQPDVTTYVCGYDAGSYRVHRPNKVLEIGKAGAHSPPVGVSGRVLKAHIDAMHSSCVVVRASLFRELGGYFTDYNCRYGEDSWLWLRVLYSGNVFWDPSEKSIFHVEDSDLGFSVQHRKKARPIVLFPERLLIGVPPTYHGMLELAAKTYAALDYHSLVRSRAWGAAAEVRRQHKLGGAFPSAREYVRRIKTYLSRA